MSRDYRRKNFQLLSEEFGHWALQDSRLLFDHQNALDVWNTNARAILQLGEELERVERQLVD
jgi:hypothetical protein